MADREKLPAIATATNAVVAREQSDGIVARGLAAIAHRNKHSSLLTGETEVIIAPNNAMLEFYAKEARATLQTPEQVITTYNDRENDQSKTYDEICETIRIPLNHFIANLNGVRNDSGYYYYAKLGSDDQELIGSIMHGYYFKYCALVDGSETDILKAIRFEQSTDGIISAFFLTCLLPTIGAFWHGAYYVDVYELIESRTMLGELLSASHFDLEQSTLEERLIRETPSGLRITRGQRRISCECLGYNDNGSIINRTFELDEDGYVVNEGRKCLLSTTTVYY